MRKRLAASAVVVVAAAATHVLAADLHDRRAAPTPPIETYSWTGVTFGVNAGYRFDGSALRFSGTDSGASGLGTALAAGAIPAAGARRPGGFLGGGGLGYDQQVRSYVVGIAADIDGTPSAGSVGSRSSLPSFVPILSKNSQSLEYLGTVRGRLGWAGIDRVLIFATGGLAFGGARSSFQESAAAGVPPLAAGASGKQNIGYTIGGGIEYAVTSHFSVKIEYLHYDFGTTRSTIDYSYGVGEGSSLTGQARQDGNLVRGGLTYRLDVGPNPAVVARY